MSSTDKRSNYVVAQPCSIEYCVTFMLGIHTMYVYVHMWIYACICVNTRVYTSAYARARVSLH